MYLCPIVLTLICILNRNTRKTADKIRKQYSFFSHDFIKDFFWMRLETIEASLNIQTSNLANKPHCNFIS